MKSSTLKKNIYQIYFDDESKNNLDSGFAALDNCQNVRPDWYEFWVIKNFLEEHTLEDDAWYGFLSPKFHLKTGLKSANVDQILDNFGDQADVVLIGDLGWDQIAYFQNSFEQGNIWHPGLMETSQKFFNHIGLQTDLSRLVSTTKDSVFSNYLIAKASYWDQWLKLAKSFFQTVENDELPEIGSLTTYGSKSNLAPLKTFIQERFPSIILNNSSLRILSTDHSESSPIFTRLFNDDPETRAMLRCCDHLKQKYLITKDNSFLNQYYQVRKQIKFKVPMA
jgi:hypothetical protein